MVCIRLWNAISHPEMPPPRSFRMKPRITTNQIQTKLFHEPGFSSIPIPLPLAADREAELKRAIAELLLNVALDDAEVPRGGECDE